MFDEESGTVFRDVTMLALAGFVAIALLLLPYVNPPGREAEAEVAAPGNVIVEARWDDGLDIDVDLWVQAPGDLPVGYSNKGGLVFNLLRDDLGHHADPLALNYEVAYGRGLPAGEYTVNLHLYRNLSGRYPVPVSIQVSVKRSSEAGRGLLASRVALDRDGQELTVVRFTLTADGALVPGSVHSLHKPLRSRGVAG